MTTAIARTTAPAAAFRTPAVSGNKRAAIYCRISDDKMEDQAGVDRQEEDCRKIAVYLGWDVVSVYKDNSKSAWRRNRKRPGWDALIEEVRADTIDAIVVYHPDRLMRQPHDLELLVEAGRNGILLHGTVQEYDLSNPEHLFMLRIAVAQACKSSDDASRRQKRKQAQMAEQGLFKGGSRPFGFEADGVVHRASEVIIIRKLVEDFLNGVGIRALTAWLNQQEVPRAKALGQWHDINIRQILASPRMAGLRKYHGRCERARNADWCPPGCEGELFPATWEAIVSESDWRECQNLLKRNRQGWEARRETMRIFEATSLTRCALCGSTMHSTGGSKVGYICMKRTGGCGSMWIGKDSLENLLRELVRGRLEESGIGASIRRVVTLDPEAEAQIRKDQEQLGELAQAYGENAMTMAEWMAAKKPIDERIKVAQKRMAASPTPIRLARNIKTTADWDALEAEERRAIYRELFDAILISPGHKGFFNPGRVEVVWAA